jgi:hypothetical protein
MSEITPSEPKKAIESQHGWTATCVQSVPIKETHGGQTVRERTVAVFDLASHPKAKRAYAWSCAMDDSRCMFLAVLHIPPVTSPRDAVRAAIVAEGKTANTDTPK